MRKIFLILVFFAVSSVSFAGNTLIIDSECVTLRDIFPGLKINDNVLCGLDYGQEKTINRQMSIFIINKYGITGATPGEVTFKRKGTLLSEDRFRQDLKNQLAMMYPDMDVEISAVRMAKDFYTPDNGQYSIEIPAGRFGNISVSLDNGYRKTSYSVSITAFREIYVTTSQIKKGEDIKDKATLFRTDLSKVHGEPVTNPEGFIAKMNISSGRPLTTNLLEKKPDALKDSQVTIVFQSGGIEIYAAGILQEDAYEGKIVRVENTASGKTIRGEYKGDRKVFINTR